MKKITSIILIITASVTLSGCWMYSFTGGSVGDAKTIQVDFFTNEASYVEPGISQKFTQDLQDLFLRQTNLTSVNSNGDLHFSGAIVGYRITPTSGTADQIAIKNRLTITINVIYTNKLIEKDSFEKEFTFYHDYDATTQLTGGFLDDTINTIFEQITQNIFNASVAKW